MYLTLPESAARRRTRTGYLASAVMHAALLALLLTNHGWTAQVRDEPQEVPILYSVVKPPPTAAPVPSTHAGGIGTPSFAVPRLNIPISIPNSVPIVESLETPFDPSEFERRAFAPEAGGSGTAAGPVSGGAPLKWDAVDRQVEAFAGNPAPSYPSALQAMSVEGSVTLRFVVDTLGRIEPRSVEVLRATHPLFERSVREALPRMRFTAAEVNGKRVRQVVEQAFHFAMKR